MLLAVLSNLHARTQKLYVSEPLQVRILQPHAFEITEDNHSQVELRSRWQEKRPGMEVYEAQLFGAVLRKPANENPEFWAERKQIERLQRDFSNNQGAHSATSEAQVKRNSVRRYSIANKGLPTVSIIEYRYTQPPWYCAIGYRPLTEQQVLWVFMRLCQLGLNPEIGSLTKAVHGVSPLD